MQDALTFAETEPGDDFLQLEPGVYDATTSPLSTFVYFPTATHTGTLTINGPGAIIDGGGDPNGTLGMGLTTISQNNDLGSDILVSNLTFRNGFSTTTNGAGLGISTNSANVTVHHCTFSNNINVNPSASGGGGLFVISAVVGTVSLNNNNFIHNSSETGAAGALAGSLFGDVTITGNSFIENFALESINNTGTAGGGLSTFTGAGRLTVDGNIFDGNITSGAAGGLFVVLELGELVMTNNIFSNNEAIFDNGDPEIQGGGAALLATEGARIIVTNNTIVGNTAAKGDGGGLKLFLEQEDFNTVADIYNNIIVDNTATGSNCQGSCNDIFVNDNAEETAVGAEVNVFNNMYADISFTCEFNVGCTPHRNVDVPSNFDGDPMFLNADGGDFRLAAGSPAIDAGTASAPFLPSFDFQGNTRIQGPNPDLGALETAAGTSSPPGSENCANNTDDDGDGKIDCNDSDCSGAAACQDSPTPPGSENCANGSDDDGDGQADCDDADCSGAAACGGDDEEEGSENCANNTDDDGDGNIDCNDPDCSGAGACTEDDGTGTPNNVGVVSGCSLNPHADRPSSLAWILFPLLLGLGSLSMMKSRAKTLVSLMLTVASLSFIAQAQAADFEVTSNGGSNDCVNSPPCDLQTALDTAEANGEDDVLNLQSGTYDSSLGAFTYNPTENKSLTIIGNGFGTVVDGGGANPGMILNTTATADAEANITVQDMSFRNGQSVIGAGGLDISTDDANITVRRCAFQFNNTDVVASGSFTSGLGGGGLAAVSEDLGQVTVVDSSFFRNSASQAFGGGLLAVAVNGPILIEGNSIVDNTTIAFASLNAPTAAGGALAVSVFGTMTLNRNMILDNVSQGGGGLLAVEVFGAAAITNNVIARNLAASDGSSGLAGGGGMVLVSVSGSADLTNNTIVENHSGFEAGGVLAIFDADVGVVNIFNNIFRSNQGTVGTICTTGCDDIVVDDDPDSNNIGAEINISFNNVSTPFFGCDSDNGCAPQQTVENNIDEDPLFAAVGLDNFHLLSGSPAIDAGSASAPGLPAKDYDLKTRNQGEAPDMGAFESAPPPVTPPGPPATENCANTLDDDLDNLVDCDDPDCSGAAACQGTNPPPTGPENCANNTDDDGDGNIDCNDPDCAGSEACEDEVPQGNSENCANQVDDDGDGQADCDDGDCSGAAACQEEEDAEEGDGTSGVSVNSGCSLSVGATTSSSLFLWLMPLGLVIGRWFRHQKSSRGR